MATHKKGLCALLSGLIVTMCFMASTAEYIKPVVENVPVFSANGTKIGIIHQIVPVKLLRQSGYMVMIEYTGANVSFAGWAEKARFEKCEAPKPEDAGAAKDPSGSDAKTEPEIKKEEVKARLSNSESKTKLRDILKIPVNYIKQTSIDKKGPEGTLDKGKGTKQTKLFMRLNPMDKNADGYAEISVLLEFERDNIITFFVNDKIALLEDFKTEASLAYSQVIDIYIRALEKYNEDLRGNFTSLCSRAESFEKVLK